MFLKNVFLNSVGKFFSWSMRKPMNKQENVPPIIIRNAAGLFIADKGAPFKIIPTKIEITPNTIPMTVASSKIKSPYPYTFIEYYSIKNLKVLLTNSIFFNYTKFFPEKQTISNFS